MNEYRGTQMLAGENLADASRLDTSKREMARRIDELLQRMAALESKARRGELQTTLAR